MLFERKYFNFKSKKNDGKKKHGLRLNRDELSMQKLI